MIINKEDLTRKFLKSDYARLTVLDFTARSSVNHNNRQILYLALFLSDTE